MVRIGKIAVISLAVLLGAAPAWPQEKKEPPVPGPLLHIQTAQEFLLGWGKKNWEAVRAHTGGKLTVKVGGTGYTLDAERMQAEVELLLPFRGLSAVRVGGKVKGVTVEEITVKVGGTEKKGKGTVTLEEQDGKFKVAGVAVE
ncbi:MAG: hypothetical protein ACREJW_05530 [Candidatus Methylomirabilales bacterium]